MGESRDVTMAHVSAREVYVLKASMMAVLTDVGQANVLMTKPSV